MGVVLECVLLRYLNFPWKAQIQIEIASCWRIQQNQTIKIQDTCKNSENQKRWVQAQACWPVLPNPRGRVKVWQMQEGGLGRFVLVIGIVITVITIFFSHYHHNQPQSLWCSSLIVYDDNHHPQHYLKQDKLLNKFWTIVVVTLISTKYQTSHHPHSPKIGHYSH